LSKIEIVTREHRSTARCGATKKSNANTVVRTRGRFEV